MHTNEFIAKYLSDLSKIIFGTVVISQIFSSNFNLLQLFTALYFMISFFALALAFLPEDTENE